jgi:hypothetical protein
LGRLFLKREGICPGLNEADNTIEGRFVAVVWGQTVILLGELSFSGGGSGWHAGMKPRRSRR